jgi:hypothetical protein
MTLRLSAYIVHLRVALQDAPPRAVLGLQRRRERVAGRRPGRGKVRLACGARGVRAVLSTASRHRHRGGAGRGAGLDVAQMHRALSISLCVALSLALFRSFSSRVMGAPPWPGATVVR